MRQQVRSICFIAFKAFTMIAVASFIIFKTMYLKLGHNSICESSIFFSLPDIICLVCISENFILFLGLILTNNVFLLTKSETKAD